MIMINLEGEAAELRATLAAIKIRLLAEIRQDTADLNRWADDGGPA